MFSGRSDPSSLSATALSSGVVTSGGAVAAVGADASFSCNQSSLSGVRQVTWQRLLPDDSLQNLATYSERFGQQIVEAKVFLAEASLRATTIVVRNASLEDEACYICSFNSYPGGSNLAYYHCVPEQDT
uniref:Ig-like domain-containing protein n=1 Tax=Denticeps clupeoides TaxID=299321 RepID=A0AAY4AIV7_9TELE